MIPETEIDDATLENWLHEVESRCPVSDNLENITPVTIEVCRSSLASLHYG
jgi:uncharacterized OsmC-like protein